MGTTSFTYDANHNRTTMVTGAGTTTYAYDSSADVELVSKTDPSGKVTTYAYDAAGNLKTATYDPTGANQVTSYTYDASGRLAEVDEPDGSKMQFTYDADGNRLSKTVTSGGPVPTTTKVLDVYQAGRIAYETDGAGATLATFAYDANGTPTSVAVGSDPNNSPRYYYVYNGHGDVVALVDGTGNVAASYSYDAFGTLTASSEAFADGWSNPYRYDGADRVRYDAETGLYWMSVRAYDPTTGRFLSRDPLGRSPLVFSGQPYAYAGNNPLKNVDPSGQQFYEADDATYGMTMNWVAHNRLPTTAGGEPHFQVDCRNLSVTTPKCVAYHGWMLQAEDERAHSWQVLAPLIGGAAIVITGAVLKMGVLLQEADDAPDPRTTLGKLLGISGVLASDIVPAVTTPLALIPELSWLAPAANVASAIGNLIRGGVSLVNGMISGDLWLMGWIAMGAVKLAIKATRGQVGFLQSAATKLASVISAAGAQAVDNFANFLASGITAAGWGLMAYATGQLASPIWDWCSANGGVCDLEPDHYDTI